MLKIDEINKRNNPIIENIDKKSTFFTFEEQKAMAANIIKVDVADCKTILTPSLVLKIDSKIGANTMPNNAV